MNKTSSDKYHLNKRFRYFIRRFVKMLRYFGLKYHCPICHSNLKTCKTAGLELQVLREHDVVGGGYRENAQCPVCGSLDRERLIYLYLTKVVGIKDKHIRLLHVAPEQELSKFLADLSSLDYLTADLYMRNVMTSMDITNIPFPNGYFDAIICNHVLEHIPDDHLAMAELWRVLAHDGWAILQVPIAKRLKVTLEDATVINEKDREQFFGQKDHVRIYGADYANRLRMIGFKVEVIRWWENPEKFGGVKNRYSLLRDEELFIVRKPKETIDYQDQPKSS